jgi:hypothetical protein
VVVRRRDVRALETEALGWALVLLALAIGLTVLVAAIAWAARGRERVAVTGVVATIVLGALVGERALYTHGERYIAARELGTWAASLAETGGQSIILEQPGASTDRVLTFGDHANRMGAVDLLQADGYQAIYPLTYHAFFGALTAPFLETDEAFAAYFGSWGNRAYAFGPAVDPELVALAGVRWLYVVGDDVPTVPGIIERFGEGEVTVYEVPDALPRAFVAGELAVGRTVADVTDAISTASTDDLRRTAWLVDGESARALEAMFATTGAATGGAATITSYAPDRVEVAVDTAGSGMLVLTDTMAPGWVAERDGAPVDMATVDVTFRGVPVDAATRRVVFAYRPAFTYLGFLIAVAAVALSLLWAMWTRRQDRA